MEKDQIELSSAIEDYLKAIYSLQADGAEVTTTALAHALDISPASVTNMIKKMAQRGLVLHERYHSVRLTAQGEKAALEVLRHHRLLELFLVETLGMPWDQVHEEAHRLEHSLSEQVEDYLSHFLGDPTEDPHGDPIPTRSGQVVEPAQQPLADLAAGDRAVIHRIGVQDPPHLRYLHDLGILPHATVQVIEQSPLEGPLRLRVGHGVEHSIDYDLACHIWVTKLAGQPEAQQTKEDKR